MRSFERPAEPAERVATYEERVTLNALYFARNAHRPLVVAGNGPSLRSIDYARIPDDALILRINSFFFEEKYFLGDHADVAFIAGHPKVLPDTVMTLLTVLARQEYTADLYLSSRPEVAAAAAGAMPVIDVRRAILNCKPVADFMALRAMPPAIIPTSGIIAIFAALGFGFRDIYVAGIDFYETPDRYAYELGPNFRRQSGLDPALGGYQEAFHGRDVDLAGLDVALRCDGAQIRTVCPDTPASRRLDLAPQVDNPQFRLREKPEGYVSDLIRRPTYAHSGAAAGRRWSSRWWRAKLAVASEKLATSGRA